MSIEQMQVTPRNQYISQVALSVFELYRIVFFAREETKALPALLGLALTMPAKTKEKMDAPIKTMRAYIDTGKFSYQDVWRVYEQVIQVINQDILNDAVFGFVPASSATATRKKPEQKEYETKLSDKVNV